MSTSFPQPTGETFRSPEWSTDELKAWVEFYQLERAAIIANPTDSSDGTIAYCEHRMDAMLEELARRKRLAQQFKNDPRGPRWSNAKNSKRTNLVELARDLKAAWPIARFMTELMMVDLVPAGRDRWKCRCVTGLHDDRTPSMTVYGTDDHVFCHACRYHGDVIDLTRLYFGISTFQDAVKRLADATVSMGEGVA